MNVLHRLEIDTWGGSWPVDLQQQAISALEHGQVLFLPRLAFELSDDEKRFLSSAWSNGKAKNISIEGSSIRGATGAPSDLEALHALIARYATSARHLVESLFPAYVSHLTQARTSYRPFEVEQRVASYKKDDKRLHVDAFPSRPTWGQRILRVFSNIHPEGHPRVWRLGEPFEDLARRYLPRIRRPRATVTWLMDMLSITKGRRSDYDHIMLRLHDMMKKDLDYQRGAPQREVALPSASTWIVFSDQVLHAAMSGQFMMEQTFHLPVSGLQDPQTAPLRVLERLTGRALAA